MADDLVALEYVRSPDSEEDPPIFFKFFTRKTPIGPALTGSAAAPLVH